MTTFGASLAIVLAVAIGFATHRASLCTVRAVREVLSSRRAHMLGSFLKTVLWVVAITMVIDLTLRPGSLRPVELWGFSYRAMAGGFVFGVGAAINGGCALGTLGLLGKGELRMVATLLGGVIGLVGGAYGQVRGWLPLPEQVDSGLSVPPVAVTVLAVALSLWVLWELRTLWRTRDPNSSWLDRILSRGYRLSVAALLLGLANGAIYALYGGWSYTRTA